MRALSHFTAWRWPRRHDLDWISFRCGQSRAVTTWLSVGWFFLATTLLAGNAHAAGGGDINVSPKRIVFDAAGHGATVYLFNRGGGAATYSIAVIDRVMIPDGEILAVDDAKKDPSEAAFAAKVTSAKDFIQFTPRRVTLKPNESQTIRLRATKPDSLPAGEYRTHLTITAVPPEDVGLTVEQAVTPGSKELSVRIVPVFSLSIPLIVRQSDVEVRAGLEAPRLAWDEPPDSQTTGKPQKIAAINVTIDRLGRNSVYGNVEVRSGDDVLGAVRGVGVYPEVERRSVKVPLSRPPKPGENLSIVLVDDDTQPGTDLAKVSFVAP